MNILKSATVLSLWCLVVIAFSTTIIAAEDETTTEEEDVDVSTATAPCLGSDDLYFPSPTGCDWTALETVILQEMKHKAPNCHHGVQRELQLLTGML